MPDRIGDDGRLEGDPRAARGLRRSLGVHRGAHPEEEAEEAKNGRSEKSFHNRFRKETAMKKRLKSLWKRLRKNVGKERWNPFTFV